MSHTELKSLETRRRKVKEKLIVKKNEQVHLSREINQLIRNVKDIESSIDQLKVKKISNQSITVTEHAILRFLERVKGIDMEEVKKEIVSPLTLMQIKALGSGYYPGEYEDTSFKVRVKDNAVVTVLTGKTF
jgi:hypothetical protein